MNIPQIFNFEQIEVRMIIVDDTPYFVGKDVAEILGYSNTPKAIRDHVDEEDKLTERIVLSGQRREVTIVNESGLYSLILKSKLPSAKKFKRWVTIEGSSQEIKELLQAIASSEEQSLKDFVSTRIDGKEIANVPTYQTSGKLEVTSRSALESAGRIGKNERL